MFWKLINWSKTLGVIINETHRLCRYFKNDLLSLSVYINYLICLDISVKHLLFRTTMILSKDTSRRRPRDGKNK